MKRKSRARVKTFNFIDIASSNRGRSVTETKYEYVGMEVPTVLSMKFCFLVCNNMQYYIEEEIIERIAAGNRAYRVHKKTIFIKINIPKLRTTIYNTLIRPTVTYAYET